MPQRENPMTEPARKAVLKDSFHGSGIIAETVVRAFENTATCAVRDRYSAAAASTRDRCLRTFMPM